MSIIQVPFDIPPEIQEGIDAGTLIRIGGVVRDALTKQIVKHLDEATVHDSVDTVVNTPIKQEGILTKAVGFIKDNKNPIICISVVTATIAAAAITYVVIKKKNNKKIKVPKCVVDFENAFITYIDAIKNEKIDEIVIDNLISSLAELKNNENAGNITITIPVENADLFLNMIVGYTKKFADANSYDISESPTRADGISTLQHCLEIQKDIILKCA